MENNLTIENATMDKFRCEMDYADWNVIRKRNMEHRKMKTIKWKGKLDNPSHQNKKKRKMIN